MRCTTLILVIVLSQIVWIETVNGNSEYIINYDPNFDDLASKWNNSTWNPADYWIKPENKTVTLYYKGNRSDWGNTEVCQGKKPASAVKKSLRFQDFYYREGSGGLSLKVKVKRDIDPVWLGSSLNLTKSLNPQANIGVYLCFEVQGWDYDNLNETSSIVIDVYFDSRHQNPNTNETEIWEAGESYFLTSAPYDKQIHAGYVLGTLLLSSWQEFDVNVTTYIDQTLQKCRNNNIELPSNELVLKFLGVYVESFSAAVQASFDYVLLKDTWNEDLNVEIDNLTDTLNSTLIELANTRSLMQIFPATTIVFMSTTVASAVLALLYIKRIRRRFNENKTVRQ